MRRQYKDEWKTLGGGGAIDGGDAGDGEDTVVVMMTWRVRDGCDCEGVRGGDWRRCAWW